MFFLLSLSKDGNFIWHDKKEEVKDAWLDDIDWVKVGKVPFAITSVVGSGSAWIRNFCLYSELLFRSGSSNM